MRPFRNSITQMGVFFHACKGQINQTLSHFPAYQSNHTDLIQCKLTLGLFLNAIFSTKFYISHSLCIKHNQLDIFLETTDFLPPSKVGLKLSLTCHAFPPNSKKIELYRSFRFRVEVKGKTISQFCFWDAVYFIFHFICLLICLDYLVFGLLDSTVLLQYLICVSSCPFHHSAIITFPLLLAAYSSSPLSSL